jgi:hypothetical protein
MLNQQTLDWLVVLSHPKNMFVILTKHPKYGFSTPYNRSPNQAQPVGGSSLTMRIQQRLKHDWSWAPSATVCRDTIHGKLLEVCQCLF